ncbi:MAG: TonB-dependent receptor [Reichenbachiella sp.]|uniref:TonB-dependent receptor n=1 Tax=Reichenbachiella sp. TaxID=2184521 RepID=UPI0032970A0D
MSITDRLYIPCIIGSLTLLLITHSASSQSRIEGTLADAITGQVLPFASIQNLNSGYVSVADSSGIYHVLANPKDSIAFSFIGYDKLHMLAAQIPENEPLLLRPTNQYLQEVEVNALRSPSIEQFDKIRPSMHTLRKDVIFQLPSMAGEPDFIKVITLMPGASKGIEGSNDFFVRGGAADQNLVLLDGATVYNTGHLFGFLSVFNPSAIGEVNIMTGGFPAEYGGRLSSIIDIRSKEISKAQLRIEGGIGLISSRVSAEIPIIKDKLAVQIAGRRTYADQVVTLIGGEELPYYFYDMNVNVDYALNKTTRLHYGFYFGDDVLDYTGARGSNNDPSGTSFVIGNLIQTLSLEKEFHRFSSTTDLTFTRFDYKINNYYQDNSLNVVSDIEDLGLKQKVTLPLSENNKLHMGFSTIRRSVNTNLIDVEGELAEVIPSSGGDVINVFEGAIFGEWEFKQGKFEGILGARASAALVEGTNYWQPEPRVALRYAIDPNWALKASYTRMSQYIHRVSSSSFALPTDIWYPVDPVVKPQTANQWTLGVSKLMPSKEIVLSAEVYYKQLSNLVEFREGTNLVLNPDFRNGLLQGNGESYGFEWLLRKDVGRLRGWLSYTLSWSHRTFDELNKGLTFPARYDRRHNAALVTNYSLNDRWSFSMIWEFISGAKFTPIIGYYAIPNASATGADLIPIYPDRNSVRLANTHRLDLSIILKGKQKPGRKWQGDWQFSLYNVYNRATPIAITIVYDENTNAYKYEQPGLLGLLPSITYNFKFIK